MLLAAIYDGSHADLGDRVFLKQIPGESAEMPLLHRLAVLVPVLVAPAIESTEIEHVECTVSDDRPLCLWNRRIEPVVDLEGVRPEAEEEPVVGVVDR